MAGKKIFVVFILYSSTCNRSSQKTTVISQLLGEIVCEMKQNSVMILTKTIYMKYESQNGRGKIQEMSESWEVSQSVMIW